MTVTDKARDIAYWRSWARRREQIRTFVFVQDHISERQGTLIGGLSFGRVRSSLSLQETTFDPWTRRCTPFPMCPFLPRFSDAC